MTIPTCPSCGQPLRPPLQICICGHTETGHDLNPKGKRTVCFHYSPAGRCPCRTYQETQP